MQKSISDPRLYRISTQALPALSFTGKCLFILSYFTFPDNPLSTRKVFNCSHFRPIEIVFVLQLGIIITVYDGMGGMHTMRCSARRCAPLFILAFALLTCPLAFRLSSINASDTPMQNAAQPLQVDGTINGDITLTI